jgi:hypothetical protein
MYWRALGFDHRDAHLAIGEGRMGAYACLAVRMACDISTKAVAIKRNAFEKAQSFIIIGYLLAIRVLAVFALSLGTTSQLQAFGTGMCTGSMVESHT